MVHNSCLCCVAIYCSIASKTDSDYLVLWNRNIFPSMPRKSIINEIHLQKRLKLCFYSNKYSPRQAARDYVSRFCNLVCQFCFSSSLRMFPVWHLSAGKRYVMHQSESNCKSSPVSFIAKLKTTAKVNPIFLERLFEQITVSFVNARSLVLNFCFCYANCRSYVPYPRSSSRHGPFISRNGDWRHQLRIAYVLTRKASQRRISQMMTSPVNSEKCCFGFFISCCLQIFKAKILVSCALAEGNALH